MRVCAIELKSNNAILSVVESDDDIVIYIDMKIKKIALEDDENQQSVQDFFKQINDFLKQNHIEKVVIKKRAKKGNFAGGAVTFKMEGLIQLNKVCPIELISSQSMSAFEKKNNVQWPANLKKYQEQAYLAGCVALRA
jgi:hypothetical protein